MMKPSNLLTVMAAVGLSLTAAGVMAVPLNGAGGVHAAGTGITERVSRGFAASPESVAAHPAIKAAAGRVAKGDFFERPGCFGQVWPEITSECLSKAAATARLPVRTVTIGTQVGDHTTVLVRMPALQAASR